MTVATQLTITPGSACVHISTSAADGKIRTHLLLNTVKRFSIKRAIENLVKELQKFVGFGALAEFCVNTIFTACRCLHLALWIGSKLQVLPFVQLYCCGGPSFHAFLVDS